MYHWRSCKKRLCHPHSWNVMHAVHRVCFKREAEEGRSRGWGALFGKDRVLEVGSCCCYYYHYYYFMKKDEAKEKNFSINLFLGWEIINDDPSRIVWSSADESREETWRERREMEG